MKNFLVLATLVVAFVSCKKDKKKVDVKEAVKVKTPAKKEGNVNIKTSVINWKGTKPTGSHNGKLSIATGSLNIENNKVKGGVFVIDMNSIVCLDIPATDTGNKKLVGHLNGADFFDVAKFPTAKFVIAEAKEQEDNKILITGNLTLKGETKSISFPATFTKGAKGYTLKTDSFKIDRTKFGITYKSKTIDAALKDKFIHDFMELEIIVNSKK